MADSSLPEGVKFLERILPLEQAQQLLEQLLGLAGTLMAWSC